MAQFGHVRLLYPLGSGGNFPANLPEPVMQEAPRSARFADYIDSLRNEMQGIMSVFGREPSPPLGIEALGRHPRLGNAIERGLTTAAMIGEGSYTTGGNIALVANALLGAPQMMRQRRQAESMEGLQMLDPVMKLRQAMLADEQAALQGPLTQAQIAKLQAETLDVPNQTRNYGRMVDAQSMMGQAQLLNAQRPQTAQENWAPYGPAGIMANPNGTPTGFMYNQLDGTIKPAPLPGMVPGAMPVEQPNATGNTDMERQLQRLTNIFDAQWQAQGNPPLTAAEREAYKAKSFQEVSGVRAAITQNKTGGVDERTTLQLNAARAKITTERNRLGAIALSDDALRDYGRAKGIPVQGRTAAARRAVEAEIAELARQDAALEQRLLGVEAPAESNPMLDLMKRLLEE